MQKKKILLFGFILTFFASSFIPQSADQHAAFAKFERQPELLSPSDFEIRISENNSLPLFNDIDFPTNVLEETARILGWHNHEFRDSDEIYNFVNPSSGMEEQKNSNSLSVCLTIRPQEDDDYISPDNPQKITFHGIPASYGTVFQDWEVSFIWYMEGYFLWVYGSNYNESYGTPNMYPYGEALYEAFWNVVNGTDGGNAAPPAPADLCADVNCKNNYCKDDGSKYFYDCTCDPRDGKCYCHADDCDSGCDQYEGGCILSEADPCTDVNCPDNFCTDDGSEFYYDCYCENGECYCESILCDAGCDIDQGGCLQMQMAVPDDLCTYTACPEDYCEEDGKTRVHDCKCDPADGECSCYTEICEAGCNAATGKCVESMVIPNDPNDADSDSSGNGYQSPPTPSGPGLLGVIGGVVAGSGVLAGGGYLSFKAVQGILTRRAAKAAAQATARSAEPSLSELLAKAEKSANRTLNNIDRADAAAQADQLRYKNMLRRNVKYDAKWAKTMAERAALIEKAEMGVKAVKKGADVAAELVGSVPGGGNAFKYGYNLTTTAAESIASGDTVGEVVLKTTSKGVETFAGNRLFGKVTVLDNMAKNTIKGTIKQVIKKSGAENIILEGIKNEGTNNFMNLIKGVKNRSKFGKMEKKIEAVAKRVDRKTIVRTLKRVLYHR